MTIHELFNNEEQQLMINGAFRFPQQRSAVTTGAVDAKIFVSIIRNGNN